MRERRFETEEIDHLRQRQGDHREIDALAADGQRPRDHAEQRRTSGAGEDRQRGIEAPDLGGVRADVARQAQEHRMAERQQPDIADEEIEGAGEECKAQSLHHEERVDHKGASASSAIMMTKATLRRARPSQARRGGGRRSFVHLRRPFRTGPAGRISSTIAMITKTTVFDASG